MTTHHTSLYDDETNPAPTMVLNQELFTIEQKTGDAEQFFATILQQEFRDVVGNQKYRIWACELTINDAIQVARYIKSCQSLSQSFGFVPKIRPHTIIMRNIFSIETKI